MLEIRAKSNAFSAAIGDRETEVANRVGSRETTMKDLFKKADDIVYDELYRFIELFRQNNAKFYDKYKAARDSRDIGIRTC